MERCGEVGRRPRSRYLGWPPSNQAVPPIAAFRIVADALLPALYDRRFKSIATRETFNVLRPRFFIEPVPSLFIIFNHAILTGVILRKLAPGK